MPDNKNQHYVPRCHLKPFSLNRDGLAINLFNHTRNIVRENVPVSSQCSKSYFYGEDLIIEKQLQTLEGRYARVVRDVQRDAQVDEQDREFLRNFIFLQWCRTDAALRRRREAMEAMDAMAHMGVEHLKVEKADLSQRAMVLGSLATWAKCGDEIADLRLLILRNRSRVDFVTSDDPAVLTNRVFLQRMHDSNFGLSNTGAMMLMPLGPSYAAICYDHDCYAPRGRVGCYVNVDRDQDVHAFNELQYLNSLSNIYFAGPIEKGDRVSAAFRAVAGLRPQARFTTWQGISEGIDGEFECFRRMKDDEKFDPRTPRIQSFSPIFPQPAHWMSNFPMRSTLIGWIKPGAFPGPLRASKRKGLRAIRIGFGPMPNRGGELPERIYQRLSTEELAKAKSVKFDPRRTAEAV